MDSTNNSNTSLIVNWTQNHVIDWAKTEKLCDDIIKCIECEHLNGISLLTINEFDLHELRVRCSGKCRLLKLGPIKTFWLSIKNLQKENQESLNYLGIKCLNNSNYEFYNASKIYGGIPSTVGHTTTTHHHHHHPLLSDYYSASDTDRISPPISIGERVTSIQPEFFKTMISLGYAFLVTWITAFVMVVVHERVPDMKRYPPLPDIFLDNVPHIPWAFHMCEITGTMLFTIWVCVLIVHKHRMVLLRRFFALAGTVFLLRCVTMLITSLSVPGTHLECTPTRTKDGEDENMDLIEAISLRVSRAYTIWSGLGMSIQGVRTCGDYMFSGHTVALTTLNFFITEYTPRRLYFLHTITWLLNMFGIFFILAAHEHYSIDVFVAFYITSRLFLYYHTLANNQALMSRDSNRTRIWFPMFSYFESSVDGIIPNEYDSIYEILEQLFTLLLYVKDVCMLTARRFWLTHNQLTQNGPKSVFSVQNLNNQQGTPSSTQQKSIIDTVNVLYTNNDISSLTSSDDTLPSDNVNKKDL